MTIMNYFDSSLSIPHDPSHVCYIYNSLFPVYNEKNKNYTVSFIEITNPAYYKYICKYFKYDGVKLNKVRCIYHDL